MSIYVNGKKMMEEINHDLPNGNLNDVKKTQIVFANNTSFPDYPASIFGEVVVIGGQRPTQLYFPHPDYSQNLFWRQAADGKNYGKWNAVASKQDIDSLQAQINSLKKQIGGVNKQYYLPYLKEVVA